MPYILVCHRVHGAVQGTRCARIPNRRVISFRVRAAAAGGRGNLRRRARARGAAATPPPSRRRNRADRASCAGPGGRVELLRCWRSDAWRTRWPFFGLLYRRIVIDLYLFDLRISNINQMLVRAAICAGLLLLISPAARRQTARSRAGRGSSWWRRSPRCGCRSARAAGAGTAGEIFAPWDFL